MQPKAMFWKSPFKKKLEDLYENWSSDLRFLPKRAQLTPWRKAKIRDYLNISGLSILKAYDFKWQAVFYHEKLRDSGSLR